MAGTDQRPLVMHVVYSFDVGGLENGVVNLVNRLPESEFRHAVVALTECAPAFCARVTRDDVEFVSLHKPPGHGWRVYGPFWRLCRRARPAIVHTRNLAALEMQVPAALAGVPVRVHGEHGRDLTDPAGESRKYRLVRRAYSPFVTHYVALSRELEQYLTATVGIGARRVSVITNGVDERAFFPGEPRVARSADPANANASSAGTRNASAPSAAAPGADAAGAEPVVVGAVGRLEGIKGQRTLVAAARRLVADGTAERHGIKVRLVGDGPMRQTLERDIESAGLGGVVELLGARNDVAGIMRELDIFVLPSLAEGISNTVLEAMASGVPVVATDVGGNAELVDDSRTGALVPPDDADALAAAIVRYAASAELRAAHGRNARARVEQEFALPRMIERYRALYQSALAGRVPAAARAA